jgi:predicted ATP-grasp superfamily ATP-dependent carboligase
MKADHQKQIEFIKDCLRKGQSRKIILPKFAENFRSTERTFNTRLKLARKALQSEFKKINEQTDIEVGKEIKKRKIKIMSVLERQVFLQEIIQAKTDVKKLGSSTLSLLVREDGTKEIITLKDKLAALSELNSMRGDYAPTRTDHTTLGKEINPQINLSHLTYEQLKSIADSGADTHTGKG